MSVYGIAFKLVLLLKIIYLRAYINIESFISIFVVVFFNLQPPGLPLLPTPATIPSGRPQYRPENKHSNNQVSALSFIIS